MTQTAFRSQLLTFNGDPTQSSQAANYETDGLVIVSSIATSLPATSANR